MGQDHSHVRIEKSSEYQASSATGDIRGEKKRIFNSEALQTKGYAVPTV